MKWFRLCMIASVLTVGACTDALDEPNAPEEGRAVDDAVRVTTSALESCALLNRRFSALEGTVDTLSCGGSTCTRSCSASNQCSTRCVPANFGVASVFLDQSILRPECRMDPKSRVNAGYPSITPTLCEARGACWDNRTRDPFYPWCYERLGTQPTCGNQTPGERVNAGNPSITAEQCVIGRNACWDDRIRNVNWCFFPVANTN